MNVQAYLKDDRIRPLLRYLDPDLPDRQRMALLAVAAGFSQKQFQALPGLAHPGRTKGALLELEAAGRIRRHRRSGWEVVPGPAATQAEVEKCLKRSKKVRMALDLLADPAEGLRVRGLGHLGTMLGQTLSAVLDALLRRVDNAMKWDQQVRRRHRLPILAFVERRLPRDYAARMASPGRPPSAPEDLIEQTLQLLAVGMSAEVQHVREKQILTLYRVLSSREDVLAHWWQILSALWAEGARGKILWKEWRLRLEAYLLRRGLCLQSELRVRGVTPRRIKAMHPVPDCGYGPWVEEELRLYRRFQRWYRPAFGPFARDLWVRSHEAVAARLRRDYDGARPHMVRQALYTKMLFEAADELSGLSPHILEEIRAGRCPAEVRQLRHRAEREWVEMPLRLAVAKAANEAARIDRSAEDRAWAIELLRITAEREAGNTIDEEKLADLIKFSKAFGRGGRRARRVEYGWFVLGMLIIDLETRPAVLAPNEQFPISAIRIPVEKALRRVLDEENVSASDRADAVERIETFLRRRARMRVVYSGGHVEEKTISLATRLIEDQSAEREIAEMFASARRRLAA